MPMPMPMHQHRILALAGTAITAVALSLPAPALAQQSYPSAEAASQAFFTAIVNNDEAALRTVLGADWKRFVPTGEIDREDIYTFLESWSKGHSIVADGDNRAYLGAGTTGRPGEDYHGYLYKILKAQGPSAKGGAYSYLIGKRMRPGFALVAWPLQHGETGVMSFMVSHDGQIYEKNLGPRTDAIARETTRFDPGEGWQRIDAP